MKIPKSVMLIDDNQSTNFIHSIILKSILSPEQIIVHDMAEDALNYLKENNKPEIIFLDINMPGMDGWEFLEEYEKSQLSQDGSIIIVMLTTSLNPDDEKRIQNYRSVKGFENKPLTTEKLKEMFDRYLTD